VVVLAQETRSFDTFAGGLNYTSDIDGLVHRGYCNPRNITSQNDLTVCARPIGVNVEPNDPDHSLSGVSMQIFGTYRPDETVVNMGLELGSMMGFLYEQQTVYNRTNLTVASTALHYLTPDHIPVFSAMADNFCLFDEWFAAVPGPTNCNRAYLTSGTSHGFGNDENVGTSSPGLPQRSIFQQLTGKSMSWINHSNRTAPSTPDAAFYDWTRKTGMNKTSILLE
jgi:phospholipase C